MKNPRNGQNLLCSGHFFFIIKKKLCYYSEILNFGHWKNYEKSLNYEALILFVLWNYIKHTMGSYSLKIIISINDAV